MKADSGDDGREKARDYLAKLAAEIANDALLGLAVLANGFDQIQIAVSEYELYLAVEDIDHSRTKTKSPQTNGICERFHKTVLNEFYRVAFRKKVYRSIDELQADLDRWIRGYNEARPHQGRWCFGKTPMQTFVDAMSMTKEKMIAA